MLEKLRKAAGSGFVGLQRRRSVRDSSPREEMEVRDRDQLLINRNDRDRGKRRRVGESFRRNESDDDDDESSDEEEMKIHQKSNNNNQSVLIRSSNRRPGLRTLRSSPLLRTGVDELFGVHVPRKARSASTKRLNDQFNRRRFSSFSPSSSSGGSSMRKRMKSVIQDDIELEVAEALFDLMKQSQSPKSPKNGVDDLNRVKSFTVENGVGGETVKVDPIVDPIEKERLSVDDDKVEEEEELLGKGKVKVNGCRFQDQTVTKLDCGSVSVGTSLMGPPLKLCASSGKEVSVDVSSSNSMVMSLDVIERRESILKQQEKIETSRSSQLVNLDLEKYAHDARVGDGSKQQPWGLKEQKSQSSNPFRPFPTPMNGWHGVLPHPGYMTPRQALPVDGNVRSTVAVQTPPFKFSQPRSKRSTTHQHIALSIQSHQQLIKKSMSSGFTGASNFYSSKQLKLNLESTGQKFAPENLSLGGHNGGLNNRSSEFAKAMKTSTTTFAPQQAADQFPAAKFFGPAMIMPFGHNHSASAVNDASLPSNSALNLAAMGFNQQNMGILQKNGSQFPIPPNIASQKNGIQIPALPFFNSSFYPSPVFDASQNQQHLSHPHASLVQSTSQNTTSSGSSSRKPPRGQKQTGANDSKSTPDKNSLMPSNGQLFSVPIQPMNGVVTNNRDSQQKGYPFGSSFGSNPSTNASFNFQMLPDLPRDSYQRFFQSSESKSTLGSANPENGLKGNFEKIPESNGAHNLTKSGRAADISASMFDGLARNMNIVTSSSSGNSVTIPNFNQHHQQLMQLQKHHMQLNGIKDPIFSSLQWENLPQQVKNSQGQTNISFGNMPLSSASFQGRNMDTQYNSSLPKNVAGNLRNGSSSSALPSHPVDVSQSGPGQKSSSPACRRNVPSILGTCATQPSELKY